jgi:tetratricopeptide (TPR) repeat protein
MLAKDPAMRMDAASAAAELAALTGVPAPAVSGAFAPGGAAASTANTVGVSTMPAQPMPSSGTPAPTPGTAAAPITTTTTGSRVAFRRRTVQVGAALVIVAAAASALLWAGGRAHEEAGRLNDLGLQAGQAGNAEQARALFLSSLQHDPTYTPALSNLGYIALSEKRYPQAESLFEAALQHVGKDRKRRAAALTNLAACDMEQKYYDRAIVSLREAFQLDSSAAGSYNNLADALIYRRQPGDALGLLRVGIGRFPGEPFLYKNAGRAARELGDLKGALGYFDTAVRLDSMFQEAIDLRRLTAQELAAGR